MKRKQITIAGLTAALALSAVGGATGAQTCPEAGAACQPIGDRPRVEAPNVESGQSRIKPQPATSDQGNTVWRAGRHFLY